MSLTLLVRDHLTPLIVHQTEQQHDQRRLQFFSSGAACGGTSRPGVVRNALCNLLNGFDTKEDEEQLMKELADSSRNAVDKDENDGAVINVNAVEQKHAATGSVTRTTSTREGQITSGTAPQDAEVFLVQIVDVDQSHNNNGGGVTDRIFGSTSNSVPVASGFPSPPDRSRSRKPQTMKPRGRRNKHKRRKSMMTEHKRGSSLRANRGSTTRGRIFGGTSSSVGRPGGTAPPSGGKPNTMSSKVKGKAKSNKEGTTRFSKIGKGLKGKGSKGKGSSSKSMAQSDLGRIFGVPSSQNGPAVLVTVVSQSNSTPGGSKASKGSEATWKGKSHAMSSY